MATYNEYAAYKRDTKYVLQWIIQSSNTIITLRSANFDEGDEPKKPNTTGQTTVAALISMTKLIAKYAANSTPEFIFPLLQSIIEARTAAWQVYQCTAATRPDPALSQHNDSHKYFIDSLHQIFEILGGKAWEPQKRDKCRSMSDDLDELFIKNRFEVLGIVDSKTERGGEVSSGSDNEDTAPNPQKNPAARRQSRPGRGKRSRKKKRGKREKKTPIKPNKPSLGEPPLESYKIIDDDEAFSTDHLLAVHALAAEWTNIRTHLQHLWKQVAYNGLHSVVAGTISMLSVAMIQRAEFIILHDFPGRDSYEAVMNSLTMGDPEKLQEAFSTKIGLSLPGIRTELDIRETYLVHTYRALHDFVVDFQKTRSGVPTHAMLKEIRDWDPSFEPKNATGAQRLAWRRSFTINWLYDLVNVFSSVVVQHNIQKGQNWAYEAVDWSPDGPWHKHRRLFGLNEFAGIITSLAMQHPTTDIRGKIYPHHVFQLQCIVDALTESRGWHFSAFGGHELIEPPREFRPRRDIDLFLGREVKNPGKGYLQGVDLLAGILEGDAKLHGNPNQHKAKLEVLRKVQADFNNWLGGSIYTQGFTVLPPSRFTNSNSNGLWEYSPYLCGVGLMEALELAYSSSLAVWDDIPEAILCIHLHNMLVRKGYIKRPMVLYATLEFFFRQDVFVNGEAPTADFSQALLARLDKKIDRGAKRRSIQEKQEAVKAHDLHDIFNMDSNCIFKTKSNLLLYRQAYWNLDRILDCHVSPASCLGVLRMAQTKHFIDPVTGEIQFQETDLIKRTKLYGETGENLLQISSCLAGLSSKFDSILPAPCRKDLTEIQYEIPRTTKARKKFHFTNTSILRYIESDIITDVGGHTPLSGINYPRIATSFYAFFLRLEVELGLIRNPVWVKANETDRRWTSSKRDGLTFLAMVEGDDECLRVMAELFQDPATGIVNHLYWEDSGNCKG